MNSLKSQAFTLIELVITLIILGIVAIYVQSKFTSTASYKANSVIAQIISSARLTQQLSMNDSERIFSLEILSNQINLQDDVNGSLSVGSTNYPISIESGVTLFPATTISFDRLGETTNFVLNISAETTQQICFEASGYIHQC